MSKRNAVGQGGRQFKDFAGGKGSRRFGELRSYVDMDLSEAVGRSM